MKKNRKLRISFFAASLLFYVAAGYALWRLGFLPQDQSFMEKGVTVLCVAMVCLSPLGLLSAFTTSRAAKRQAADQDNAKASELRLRSHKYFIRGLLDLIVGSIGYYAVTRRVFPQIDSVWILMVVVLPTSLVEIAFQLKLSAQKTRPAEFHRTEPHVKR